MSTDYESFQSVIFPSIMLLFLLGPNTALNTLFSNTYNLDFPLELGTKCIMQTNYCFVYFNP
jgi:hypothetical protein